MEPVPYEPSLHDCLRRSDRVTAVQQIPQFAEDIFGMDGLCRQEITRDGASTRIQTMPDYNKEFII